MEIIRVPASLTLEKGIVTQRYKWKIKNKVSVYRKKNRRAALRFSSINFVKNIGGLDKKDRQVNLKFIKKHNNWVINLCRCKQNNITLQTYSGSHPYVQIIVNRSLPKELWEIHKKSKKKTITLPVTLQLTLKEWKDIGLKLSDFLIDVEKESKTLLNHALENNFISNTFVKGRAFDLQLVSPKGQEFLIAITNVGKSSEIRRKEKIKQKILLDIAKILPTLENKRDSVPVIISRPLESEKT